jgi:hypothetical protein
MNSVGFSRRGFLTRVAAGAVGLIGSSVVGGLSTRAWARPLRGLRAGHLPVVDKPRSLVLVGLEEARRRERRASQLPEFQTLVRDLISSGYKRSGVPVGGDGVPGYLTEGGQGCFVGFAKDGSDKASVWVNARWWDQPRAPSCFEDDMPDVFSTEVIYGTLGTQSVVRYRYVDDQGALAAREEIVETRPGAVDCPVDCHLHPPGPCPEGCSHVCSHCYGPRNICKSCYTDPECGDACFACNLIPHWLWSAACNIACGIACETCDVYCCDYADTVCCDTDTPPFFSCL